MSGAAAHRKPMLAGLAARAAVAAVVGLSLDNLFYVPGLVAVAIALIVFIRLFPHGPSFGSASDFPLPQFVPAELEFDAGTAEADELLLDQLVASVASEPVPALSIGTMPSVREMHAAIEWHLRTQNGGATAAEGEGEAPRRVERADASDDLRDALAELRRSLA